MVRRHFILLAVFTVLTVIMALPGIASVVMIFTFGLAQSLLVVLPMATILLWAFLPAVLARRSRLRWPALVLGSALPASLLLLPGKADRAAQAMIGAKSPVVAQAVASERASGVEIIRNVKHDPLIYSLDAVQSGLYGDAPCFDICEQLLTGGVVAWVRIVRRDDAFVSDKVETGACCSVLARDADCHAFSADFPVWGSTRIRFVPDDGQPAAQVLDLQDDRVRKDRASAAWPLEEIGYRTATVQVGNSIDGPVVFRGVQLFYTRPNGLLVLDLGDFGGEVGGGFALWRTRAVTPPIDLAAAISRLGHALGPQRSIPPKTPGNRLWVGPPPDAQVAACVASLPAIDPLPDLGRRSNAFAQVAIRWQGQLQWKTPMTEADREILCASLQDTFIPASFWAVRLRDKNLRR